MEKDLRHYGGFGCQRTSHRMGRWGSHDAQIEAERRASHGRQHQATKEMLLVELRLQT